MASSITANEIEKSLEQLRTNNLSNNSSSTYRLGASGNVVILSSDSDKKNDFHDYFEVFSLIQPSRFFFLKLVRDSEAKIEVNSVCHKIGNNEHVCSEIISIQSPLDYLPRVASIFRANILPGFSTEFIVLDQESLDQLFPMLSQIPDVVYLDSLYFRDGLKAILKVRQKVDKVIDMNWSRISCWREATRFGFEPLKNIYTVQDLSSIEIGYNSKFNQSVNSTVLLLAGWIMSKCSIFDVNVNFVPINSNLNSAVIYLHINFKQAEQKLQIEYDSLEYLKIDAKGVVTFNSLLLKSQETTVGWLKKYLLIGESQRNFLPALEKAITLY